jgi:hypothetical protein
MSNMWVTITFLVLIVGTIAIFKVLIDRAERGGTEQQEKNKKEPRKRNAKIPVQDFIDVRDIRRSVIIGSDNHYSMIIRAGSVNYYLMSPAERSVVINGLLGMANSISFPIQIFSTTELIDTMDAVKEIKNHYSDLPSALKPYSAYLSESLTSLRYDQNVMVKHSYIIIPYYTRDSFEDAYSELTRRSLILIDGLGLAGIKASVLSNNEIVDFLHGVMNREDTLKPSEVIEEGGLDLYVG